MRQNNLILCSVAAAAALVFAHNIASASEQAVPAYPATSSHTNLKTGARRDQGLDLSRLIRKNADLAESALFSTNSLFPQTIAETIPVKPAAPALPFVFLGRIKQDGMEAVFLAIDERSFTAKVNDVLDDTYLVTRIEQDSIVFTYLPLKTQQILNISHGQ